MESTIVNLKDKVSSISGDSDKGSCTEALQTGVTGRDPREQGAGETPLIGEERLSPSSFSPENLRQKASKLPARIVVVLPKSEQGGLGSRMLLLGTLAVANLALLQAVSHKLRRSLVHLGSNMGNLWRVRSTHQAQARDSGQSGAPARGGGRLALTRWAT